MFDTMTMTKAVAGVCGALLVFLLGNWAATSLYAMGGGGHGAAEEGAITQAYSIDTGASSGGEEAAGGETIDIAAVLASGDAAAGEGIFSKKCKSCHKIDGTNGTGPHLDGVVGRNHGAVDGFGYSNGMKEKAAEPWSGEALFAFLESPKTAIPGTKMSFAGLPKPQERADLIAYLTTISQ
ncbi:MAG: cytochrome c family protein [Paracoccaceae bacterium]